MNSALNSMIFFRVGWMKRYQGLADDDVPQGGGTFVLEHKWDTSMFNFLEFAGRYYGVRTGKGGVDLDRLGALPGTDHLDGVTVVWVSPSPTQGLVIVGWYRDASLFRQSQHAPEGSGRVHDGESIGYHATAKVEESHLLTEPERLFRVPRGKGGMGQANVWYADKPEHEPFKRQVGEYIASLGKTLPPNLVKTWIFQANPKLYDIDAALASGLNEMTWSVSAYQDEINPGDDVFLWKSGDEAGVIAEATVLTAPQILEQDSLQFALQPEKFSGPQPGVRLRIDEVYAPPLPRDDLRVDVRLAELSILRSAQGTNFPVTPDQATVIRELLETHLGGDEIPGGAGEAQPPSSSRVWAYAPGPKAQFWEEFYRDEIMAIGWDELGDLRKYPDHDAVAKKIIEVYLLSGYPINDSRACDDFLRVMKPGDRVIVKRGRDEVVGYGIITGEYEYRPERATYRHVRRVRWERRGNWKSKPVFAVKTLTDFTRYPETVQYLIDLIGVSEMPTPIAPAQGVTPYTVEEALKGVAFERVDFEDIVDLWKRNMNLILQGPPGVGKTFLARRLAYVLIGCELPARVEMVQFHQSYSYEDFIQGYRPAENGFSRKDGIFVRFCKRASLDQNSRYVFIIDEINRSNLSKVFGELMVLIEADKRGGKNSLALTYSASEEEQFYVPPNVYVLGMMNTADRSLALVDYALRRRFAFVELKPLFGSPAFDDFLITNGASREIASEVSARLQALNKTIAADQNLGPGFMIGHSYFCGNGSALTESEYQNAIQHQILPQLKEYWFDDQDIQQHWVEKLTAKFD